jgi:hypothetical protein
MTNGVPFPLLETSPLYENEDLKIGGIPTVTPIEQVRDEGNCGEVTNRGEEACECAGKLTKNRRQPHSRQICEVTDRNLIQVWCGQGSPRTKVRHLVRLGVSLDMAIKHAISRKSYWRLSRTPARITGPAIYC